MKPVAASEGNKVRRAVPVTAKSVSTREKGRMEDMPAILRDIGAVVWTTVIEGLGGERGVAALLQLAGKCRG